MWYNEIDKDGCKIGTACAQALCKTPFLAIDGIFARTLQSSNHPAPRLSSFQSILLEVRPTHPFSRHGACSPPRTLETAQCCAQPHSNRRQQPSPSPQTASRRLCARSSQAPRPFAARAAAANLPAAAPALRPSVSCCKRTRRHMVAALRRPVVRLARAP